MLAATFSFANSNETHPFSEDSIWDVTSEHAPAGYSEWRGSPDPGATSVFDCTIKGTITIIFNDGTKMTLKDANITFVGVSCIQLLKDLMSAS